MFDVFGDPIDKKPAPTDVQWRTVHRAPLSLSERSPKAEIFETGIKATDVLVPLERGGKAGLFGGTGVGKTVLLTEAIHNMSFVNRSLQCRAEDAVRSRERRYASSKFGSSKVLLH